MTNGRVSLFHVYKRFCYLSIQISPRPPPQKPPGERRSRLTVRRGSTPCALTHRLVVLPEEKRAASSSPARRKHNPESISPISEESNQESNVNLGNLLAVGKVGDESNPSSKEVKRRDTLINRQRRQNIKQFNPDMILESHANRYNDNDLSKQSVKTVTWNTDLTKSSPNFGYSPVKSVRCKETGTRAGCVGNGKTPRSATPCTWSHRTDTEIEEQVEAELKTRVADRRRQLRNMVKSGRRLSALQVIGPRAHKSMKMVEHLPGNRLKKVLDDVDFNRTTNELIEVRIETLKLSFTM